MPVFRCPVCERPMSYLDARYTPTSEWFTYRCTRHGLWTVSPDNGFIPEQTI